LKYISRNPPDERRTGTDCSCLSVRPGSSWTSENRPKYNRDKLRYPSDLTDDEWSHIEPIIPPVKRGGRKRSVEPREIVNGLMYVLSTGCQWRYPDIRNMTGGASGWRNGQWPVTHSRPTQEISAPFGSMSPMILSKTPLICDGTRHSAAMIIAFNNVVAKPAPNFKQFATPRFRKTMAIIIALKAEYTSSSRPFREGFFRGNPNGARILDAVRFS
jgi:hypothetical protein